VSEREARVELAALHRLVEQHGWGNLIYNHCAARVPGEPDHFLIKPHGLTFNEVTASNLVKLPLAAREGTAQVSQGAFGIHAAILQARPDLHFTMHIHTRAGMAMSAHGKGLLPMTQDALRFYGRLSYHDYSGFDSDGAEAARLAASLGPRNKAMILRNHGVLTCGRDAGETLSLMRDLVASCEAQLALESTGAPIALPAPEVCQRVAAGWEKYEQGRLAPAEWIAHLRVLDRLDPSYKE